MCPAPVHPAASLPATAPSSSASGHGESTATSSACAAPMPMSASNAGAACCASPATSTPSPAAPRQCGDLSSKDLDVDSPEARLEMVSIVLHAIAAGKRSPVALARAGLDLIDLTGEQRAAMRGEGPPSAASSDPDWQWWSGPNEEWYPNGPFATRDEAVAALDGAAGYVTEALPPAPIHLSAEQLLEDQFFENNDHFDFDHAEPDRRGDDAAIVAADAELQVLLDRWCDRAGHTFARGNLFVGQRNGQHVDAVRVESDPTPSAPCDGDAPDSTDGGR